MNVQGEGPRLGREAGRTGLGGGYRLHLRPTGGGHAPGRQQATSRANSAGLEWGS